MRNIKIVFGVIVLVCVVSLIVFTTKKPTQHIKIGAMLPLSGKFANLGEDVRNGLELAKKDIEVQKGITLDIVYEDSAADPKTAILAANKLVNLEKVDVVISGPGSSANLAVVPLMAENNTVFIAISSTPKLNTAGKNIIKVQHDIDLEADYIARYAYEQGLRSVAIVYDSSSDTHITGRDVFTKTFTSLGGKIVTVEGYTADIKDFKTIMTKVKASKAEALYLLALDKVGGSAVKQVREIGLSVPIFGFSAFESEEFVKGAGSSVEGVVFTGIPFSCEGEKAMKKYCNEYSNTYKGRQALQYGAHAYDVLIIIADTVTENKSKLDKNKVIEAFENKNYSGVSGSSSFDSEGNIQIKDFVLRTVKDGKFEVLK